MRRTILSMLLVFGVMAAGLLTGSQVTMSAWAKGAGRYTNLDTFAQALHHIERHFVDEIKTQDLIYGAIDGMTDALDKHSVFLEPSEMTESTTRTDGWYTGIGIEAVPAPDGPLISRVISESPADMAGVLPGDRLIGIDGAPTADMSLADIGASLRGAEGTGVHVALKRSGALIELNLTRIRVRDKAVRVTLVEPGWAVAEITHFQRNSAADLSQGLERARADGGRKLQGLMIDLRDNPGGLLDEAVAIVDLFLNNGLIFESRGRGGVTVDRLEAHAGSAWPDLPIVVLVNRGSASASEIVAGSLQAHGRATIVGTPTYGKGSVQRMYVFEDESALKLTVSRYYLAGGKVVADEVGIVPDVQIAPSDAHRDALSRIRELVADLPAPAQNEVDAAIAVLRQAKPAADVRASRRGTLAERLTQDPQLRRAWKIIQETR
jgi:carboxyl-terminal processing protease